MLAHALTPRQPSMAADFLAAMRAWRKWYLIGLQNVRSRYARSRLGQFWISISYLITIVALATVYNHLWKITMGEYLPYLAVSHIFWALISGMVLEGCNTFIASANYLQAEEQPKGVFAMIVIWRQIVYFAHNLVVLIPLLLFMHSPITWTTLLVFPGLLLVLFNGYWVSLLIGMLCARFRDLPSMIGSLMQVVFFIVPVMWMPRTITSPRLAFWLLEANPFAAMLALVREPMLGHLPTLFQYGNVLAVTGIGLLFTAFMFRRFSARITYWL